MMWGCFVWSIRLWVLIIFLIILWSLQYCIFHCPQHDTGQTDLCPQEHRHRRSLTQHYTGCSNRTASAVCLPSNASSTVLLPWTGLTHRGTDASRDKLYDWYVTNRQGGSWGDLVAYPSGSNWRSWIKSASALHQHKIIHFTKTPTGFTINANLTGNNSIDPPGAPGCWMFTFWALKSGHDQPYWMKICQMPPSNITALQPITSPIAQQRGITVMKSNKNNRVDSLFQIATGISGLHGNNWLLLAEQAANMSGTDCVVCTGPRPILRVVPAPIDPNCVYSVMTQTTPSRKNCSMWDTIYPMTAPVKVKPKPIYSNHVAVQNFTCVNFTAFGKALGNLSSVWCPAIITVNAPFRVIPRADIW